MPRYSSWEAFPILLLAALLGLLIWGSHFWRVGVAGSDFQAPWPWTEEAGTLQPPQGKRSDPLERERPGSRIDPNRAGQEELERLPGIGSVLAARIIRYRQRFGFFQEVEDLKKVDGIGERRFERIQPWLRMEEGKR